MEDCADSDDPRKAVEELASALTPEPEPGACPDCRLSGWHGGIRRIDERHRRTGTRARSRCSTGTRAIHRTEDGKEMINTVKPTCMSFL